MKIQNIPLFNRIIIRELYFCDKNIRIFNMLTFNIKIEHLARIHSFSLIPKFKLEKQRNIYLNLIHEK
jgi:hypothetical protein